MGASSASGLWLLLLGAIAGTYLWRALGVALATRINPAGPIFQWVTCVSYAMLSGLIARMVLLPVGPLVESPLLFRVTGIAVGLGVFYLFGRRVLPAVFAGLITFIALTLL
jgi:branched-subunit amino acid transport protein